MQRRSDRAQLVQPVLAERQGGRLDALRGDRFALAGNLFQNPAGLVDLPGQALGIAVQTFTLGGLSGNLPCFIGTPVFGLGVLAPLIGLFVLLLETGDRRFRCGQLAALPAQLLALFGPRLALRGDLGLTLHQLLAGKLFFFQLPGLRLQARQLRFRGGYLFPDRGPGFVLFQRVELLGIPGQLVDQGGIGAGAFLQLRLFVACGLELGEALRQLTGVLAAGRAQGAQVAECCFAPRDRPNASRSAP